MKRTLFSALTAMLIFFAGSVPAAEKLQYGTSVKTYPIFYLPVLAAEEKGFWKQNGLEVEWVPFASGAAHSQAIAAGAIRMGSLLAIDHVAIASRGIPILAVAELRAGMSDFVVWVRADSPIKGPKELKGVKIGVSRAGAGEHTYAQLAVKALGLEKEVKFIGTGGIVESLASLKAGNIDGVVLTRFQMIERKLQGEVRDVLSVDDYLPKDWLSAVVYATREFAKKEPETVKKVIRSLLKALDAIRQDPTWTKEKMKSMQGYSDAAANMMYERLNFSKDGRINQRALEKVRNFAVEYGIAVKEKTPAVAELYATEFVD